MKQEDLGRRGEEIAARALRAKGYRILATRWRCPLGEIDLIAQDGEILVFVEVKTRVAPREGPPPFGRPEEAITGAKVRKLGDLAATYLKGLPAPPACRFDVVAVEIRPDAEGLLAGARRLLGECRAEVRHIPRAFTL